MITTVNQFSESTGNSLQVRVGIHTSIGGDVIAAVVGKVKRTYDLFGSDVKIAQLMEMTGITNELHISNNTYKSIKSEKRKSLFIEKFKEGDEILMDKYAEPLQIPTNSWVTHNVLELLNRDKEKSIQQQ
ncbi:predicted protein [Naegleria gruberi]|nr:uncharacterized protein NAEGRDRAFT_76633 [Naegleria gruberi]EFC35710.1 predicted protein [Naegleria gruberi]|eukprot:XP_002668454.1 predicted protein [Naegleria gruberi strain NEG-M]